MNVFLNRQVDAFIIAPAEHTEGQVKTLQESNIPVVLIDRYFPAVKADCVHINNFQAAYQAVDHLAKSGRKKIAMMAYQTTLPHMQERMDGYKAALRDNNIRYKKSWLRQAAYQHITKDITAAMKDLLEPDLQVDAFFFATNTLAVESLKIINHSGIKVPDELAIISFDENDAFDFFYAPVSYMSQSIEDIGKGAVQLVLDRIKHPRKKPASLVVEAKLVLRDSSGRKK
jgi:LacI family transcriptional regulator